MADRPTDDDTILTLVSRALELRDNGDEAWLEHACGDHAEHVDAVRRAVELASGLPEAVSSWAASDSRIGSELAGRYRLSARLGAGAMGIVYRAHDQELGRDVAVKVLRLGLSDPQESVVRFLREAEAIASVRHEAVVTIHDRGSTPDGEPYLVMELLEGTTLADLLDAAASEERARTDAPGWIVERLGIEPPDTKSYLRSVVHWTADMANGLHAVHRAGILHRDLKPSNVFVRTEGGPVILDFGTALLEGAASLTRHGASIGTPAYMAPEVLAARSKPNPAVDTYGLTATLYHMLTLRAPYRGSAVADRHAARDARSRAR